MRARGRARQHIVHPQWGSTSRRLLHRRRLSLESLAHASFFSSRVTKGHARGSGKGREVISGEYRAGDLGIVGGLFPLCGRGARYWAPIPPTNSRAIQTMELQGSKCKRQIQGPNSYIQTLPYCFSRILAGRVTSQSYCLVLLVCPLLLSSVRWLDLVKS
jgi:hypothetical protein